MTSDAQYDLRSITKLRPDSLRGVTPATDIGPPPTFEWVDPRDIFVEAAYQREIGQNGVALIRKIYGGFSWAKFKPPVCVRDRESGVLVCIDGQHTATAAATHPDIGKIPVMVVTAADAADRAEAFVGHNRDRLALTQAAIFRGELAAGVSTAADLAEACRAAGVTVPDGSINLKVAAPIGTTIAIGTMRKVLRRQGRDTLLRTLRILVAAKRGPIKAGEISAVAILLASTPEIVDAELTAVIASRTSEQWAAAAVGLDGFNKIVIGQAIAVLWAKELGIAIQKPRRKAVAAKSEPPVPKPAEEETWNGITFGVDTGIVSRSARAIKVNADQMAVLRRLGRVMPAMLDEARLIKAVFGDQMSGRWQLQQAIDALNTMLPTIGLTIKQANKIGVWLIEL